MHHVLSIVCIAVVVSLSAAATANPIVPPPRPVVDGLVEEAKALESVVRSQLARTFLAEAENLPPASPRIVYRDEETRAYTSARDARAFSEEERNTMLRTELDAKTYYYTKYGSPLAFARVVDLLGANGLSGFSGKRVLDFGYGSIGQLRMMAQLGGEAVGVDVDTFLHALYSERSDQGSVAHSGGTRRGHVRLVHGRWPGDDHARQVVGDRFDAIVTKNTLKRGYIHPEREVDPRLLIDLGVSDEAFVRATYDALVPGGLFLIYNLSPAPSGPDEPYKPWADGRCPFPESFLAAVGFEIIEYDTVDHDVARAIGHALGWDQGERPMNLQIDLFAQYTLVRKPVDAEEDTE